MRIRSMGIIGLVGAIAAAGFVGSRPQPVQVPPRPAPTTALRATIAIARPDRALTFARSGEGAAARTMAVTRYRDGVVTGIDLSPLLRPGEDAIAAYNRLGYEAIFEFVSAAKTSVSHDADTLAVPVDLRAVHAAVATNYPEHADEAKVKSGPFMFAKVAQPTASRAPIPASNGLLDYEGELCFVTLAPLPAAAGAKGGLILCNDVTDRAALLRGVDTNDTASGKGFTDGKSGAGFLPVGDLFVVPRDMKAFVRPLELHLAVNGEERQRTRVTNWIWDLDRLLIETGKRAGAVWTWRGGSARLPVSSAGVLSDRTLVLAGTPAGTIFQGPGPATFVRGAFDWAAKFGRAGPVAAIIERTITDDRASGGYLKPGDVVTIQANDMGSLENRIK
ncbi:MAG: fumarylacetoacetate hydrolase family protein [Sphingomonadales bacterium]|jgi:2-keto-4-pentenoate hydratase/2-oxohepta-3-ene-1,7-dioic acid hydratase in catechol pathway